MDEKVNNLFEERPVENLKTDSITQKVNAIESIADDAEETELETTKVINKPLASVEPFVKPEVKQEKKIESDNNKMWTLAVVGSVLILVASAAGMIFILLRG